MKADIKGALEQINKSYKAFVHNDMPMTKKQVVAVLEYGLEIGYKHTGEFSNHEVDLVLRQLEIKQIIKKR